jgi:hypothetical protein
MNVTRVKEMETSDDAVKIIDIPKFPEHACLNACVGLPGLPSSGPKLGASFVLIRHWITNAKQKYLTLFLSG